METLLRAALIEWLRGDPICGTELNEVSEESPVRASAPWLGIAASASTDWSTKDRTGREIRIALELHCRGDDPATAAMLAAAIERRVEAMPRFHSGMELISTRFLRARAEQRPANARAVLMEYRFRVLDNA